MATRTSVGSGNWSAAGTWDTGVPADTDAVVIASGHVVTFDADQSAFTTGVKITITGTLNHALTGGPYTMFLKTGASVIGAGTWNVGTSANPIPFAVKHTITGAAGWYVDGNSGLNMTVYGAEPSIKTIKLSNAEAVGQTELSVDTDITGDIWADGDIVHIDNVNKAADSEERIIAAGGRASNTLTITAGLTNAKIAGALVHLITRNIRIIAVGTGARTIYRVGSTANKLTIGGGMWYGVGKDLIDSSHYVAISGGAFSNNSSVCYVCTEPSISGGVFSKNASVINSSPRAIISGGSFSGSTSYAVRNVIAASIRGGIFSGNAVAVTGCTFLSVSGGTFSGNANTIIYGTTVAISGATFVSNNYDLYEVHGRLFNITLTSTVEHNSYTSIPTPYDNCQSDNHDGVDGAIKAWCKGGVVTSQNTTVPSGYSLAYTHALESASYPCFWRKYFGVPAGTSLTIEVQLRKTASMSYLPRVYLMNAIENPLAGATAVDSFTMTDSTDTWEADTFTIDNSAGTYDKEYVLWFVGQNATGSVYSAYDFTPPTGGGGSVKILPLGGIV